MRDMPRFLHNQACDALKCMLTAIGPCVCVQLFMFTVPCAGRIGAARVLIIMVSSFSGIALVQGNCAFLEGSFSDMCMNTANV